MDFQKLAEPFPASDIEWRIQSSGTGDRGTWALCLAYVTNRAIMDRLDAIAGPANWKNEYTPGPCGGILCGLSLFIDGQWVTKWDGAANTEVSEDGKLDTDTNVKGGLSASMKRAAVQWGIGRYLYNLDIGYANISQNGKNRGKLKDKTAFRWDPPELPAWALPSGSKQPPAKPQGQPPAPQPQKPVSYKNGTPENFKRAKELGDKLGLTDAEKAKRMADSGADVSAYIAGLEKEIAKMDAIPFDLPPAQEPSQPEIF